VLTPIHGTWRLNSIVCAYCGQSMDFIPESGREEAIQIVSAHEAICEQNPLVQKLQSAQEEISLLEAVRNAAQYADQCYVLSMVGKGQFTDAEHKLNMAMANLNIAIRSHLDSQEAQ
jgi:hypothetical protein